MHYHGHRERLRNKLLKDSSTLDDYEILELLLGQVVLRKDTKPLAKKLLQEFHSVKGVLEARPAELLAIDGFGPALLNFWVLLRELMSRYVESPIRKYEVLCTPAMVGKMARQRLAGCPHEEIWVAYVDTQNRLLSWEQYKQGTVDNSVLYPRDILERALILKASGFILVHNHPGGRASPSGADLQTTEQLRSSARAIGLRFLDHVIVTDDHCFSLQEDGLLL